MAVTIPPRSSQCPAVSPKSAPSNTPLMRGMTRKRRLMLQTKLTRQRALLLANVHLSCLTGREAEAQSDLVDQATEGMEQELTLQARIRALEHLHRIERALHFMQTNEYGRCRSCHQEIPYKRLAVNPDTVYCVPCLTRLEEE